MLQCHNYIVNQALESLGMLGLDSATAVLCGGCFSAWFVTACVCMSLQFCFDMWLMFDNAWAYNKKTSRVYKYSSKLAEVFEQHINGAMAQLGYCCGMRVSECSLSACVVYRSFFRGIYISRISWNFTNCGAIHENLNSRNASGCGQCAYSGRDTKPFREI